MSQESPNWWRQMGRTLQAQIETVLAALRQPEQTQAQISGSGAASQGSGDALGERAAKIGRAEIVITGDNNSVHHIIHQYAGPGRPDEADNLRRQIGRYLAWLLDWAGTLELRGIQRQGEQVVQLPLEDVYVPLAAVVGKEGLARRHGERERGFGAAVGEEGRPEETGQQAISLAELLGLGRRLILTGGPGCGKTTVLLHVAWALAQAIAQDDAAIALQKLGLPAVEAPPLPLFVPLSAYAAHRRTLPAGADRTLATFISRYLFGRQTSFELPAGFFPQLLRSGRAIILLLDGLDEVPDETERASVRQAIEDLVTGRDDMRVVVTCRTAAYQGRTALGRGFRQVMVQPLDEEQGAALVEQAYAHLYQHDPALRQKKSDELRRGIGRMEAERQARLGQDTPRLIDSPLLVRMLLIVHYRERRLPEQRAELYMKATDAMLLPDYAPDEEIAGEIGRWIGGSWEVHRDLVQHLAFHMHQRGEKQGREISEQDLKELLSQQAAYAPLVKDFIALTRLRGTVLEERFGQYRFLHLAFQEYLAARYLAEITRSQGGIEAIAAFLEAGPLLDSWWREVILLVAGYFSVASPQTAELFLERLAGVGPSVAPALPVTPAVPMAAVELAACAWLEWPAQRENLRQKLVARLHEQFSDPAAMTETAAPLRAATGRALARLGDPRPEVATVDAMRFCYVPAGPFWLGSDDSDPLARDGEKPLHQLDLPYGYWIGQYPVTNAQFAEFTAGGGYGITHYWLEARQLKFWEDGRFKGRYDHQFRAGPLELPEPFPLANHPVVGVSWYEALAFSRWLTERWQERGLLPPGWTIHLPSEAEWEKAARGGLAIPAQPITAGAGQLTPVVTGAVKLVDNPRPQRRFPWGDSEAADRLESGRCNDEATGLGATSAVGAFPGDNSPCGLFDVVSNVFEWTRSLDESYPYNPADGREKIDASDAVRILRGGSWVGDERYLRCACRGRSYPFFRYDCLGMRLVASPSAPLPSVRSGPLAL